MTMSDPICRYAYKNPYCKYLRNMKLLDVPSSQDEAGYRRHPW